MRKFLINVVCACCLASGVSKAEVPKNEANIGVLAYRGSDQLQQKWRPLSEYLTDVIPEWSFRIVPMTLSSATEQIKSGKLDFVITNPGHFVMLNRDHRMSVLASRSQRKSNGQYSSEFGSAIITLKDSGIKSLSDVAGKSVAAIGANAFGGFQVAWYEFDRAGVDLFSDTSSLIFAGFPMDQVVSQVMTMKADVGIVRGGLMEELISEGRIAAKDFVYLNSNVTYGHPDTVSTNLYPEWPFAALATAVPDLKNQVALALLQTHGSPLAEMHKLVDHWVAPLPYHGARELVDAFQRQFDQPSPGQSVFLNRNAVWVVLFAVISVGATLWWRRRDAASGLDPVSPDGSEKDDCAGLTPREHEVLSFIAQGYSTKEIAIDLGISPKTVEFHRANMLRKFGARTSSQLVAMAT